MLVALFSKLISTDHHDAASSRLASFHLSDAARHTFYARSVRRIANWIPTASDLALDSRDENRLVETSFRKIHSQKAEGNPQFCNGGVGDNDMLFIGQ
jgi:hypothetical protein